MIEFGHEMLLLGIGLVLAFIGWTLKKEHSRIESNEEAVAAAEAPVAQGLVLVILSQRVVI